MAIPKSDPVVFVLWGAYAQKKLNSIDTSRHTVIQSAHPSPRSANLFFAINAAMNSIGKPEIKWQIPDI